MDRDDIAGRLAVVRERIGEAAGRAGRAPQEIRILAVTKAHGKDLVRAALEVGLTDLGENYVQEGIAKMGETSPGVRWHFIGRVQSNKTRAVARYYDWVHTLTRERIALRLNAQRPAESPPLNVCIQVRMQEADTRPALPSKEVPGLAALISEQPRLRLRGLMGIPLPDAPREAYSNLRSLYHRLNASGLNLDTLSMGMTADLETAVECGATLVRVGTALFGPRPQG